jgi:hypothetical protein
MPGSASFDPPPVPPFAPPASFAVFKYVDRNASGDPEWTPLPWLVFVSHQERADSQPPLARLRYDFSEINPDAWPRRAHEAVDLSAAASPYRLNSDDRVVVFRTWADGSWKIVADGFAQLPQMTIERSEMVFVDVKDVSIRCFDMPIRGAVVRDAHGIDLPPGADPTALGVDEYEVRDIETEARVRFNPDGKPNATPDGVDGGPQDDTGAGEANEGKQYPVFVDWRLDREPDKRRFWTLDMAVRYLIGYYNRKEEFVINKQLGDLSGFLKAIVPTTEDGTINLDDNSSWEYEDIIVTDTDVTGMTWPDAVAHLIEPHGFILRFLCDQDPAVDDAPAPRHRWYILRRDSRLRRKTLLMEAPAPGITVDFGASNVAGLTMQRDYPRGNSVRVLCGRSRKEASFILSPAFMPAGPDAGEASRVVFGKGHPDFKENSVKYRTFIAAEAGDEWYDRAAAAMSKLPTSLLHLYPDTDTDELRLYSHQRRPPIRQLLTRDAGTHKPLDAQLWISPDWGIVKGDWNPCLWEPGLADDATWQRVTKGGWRTLEDQIGIYLDVEKPWEWNIGRPEGATWKNLPGAKIDVIKALATPDPIPGVPIGPAAPTPANPWFALMLTVVVEDDRGMDILAGKRKASPTQFVLRRLDDSTDRFREDIITEFSFVAKLGKKGERIARNDTRRAESRARSLRRFLEPGKWGGRASIPWISHAYEVGDQITDLEGRDVSFNGLVGSVGQSESPVCPCVVGVDLINEPEQGTVLLLSDRRAEPARAVETPKKKGVRDPRAYEVRPEERGKVGTGTVLAEPPVLPGLGPFPGTTP